ncbi:B3/B4 domain-containing protein [Miltoncostaea marina]|uniref:B3/B4 domain-containing protein n=1 Tax=Miltoncostaea marina TaxID=2843215 RepID=UPI001C3C6D10|nr:phenylalanine--tRNA ligase beta subunit-related protein [Miltoncostaea marina]
MFAYDPAVAAAFPAARAGVVHAAGVAGGPAPEALRAEYAAEQRAAAGRLAATPVAEMPSIAAWRRAFSAFGVRPTQHRSAAEALLRRLGKEGAIPSIGALVDIGNLVSIRHALPVAVFDLAALGGGVTVRFADGDERFTDLGSGADATPERGEVVLVDRHGAVVARRWCWRQSTHSVAGPDTSEALLLVEGHHDAAAADVAAAVADLVALLQEHQPGCRTSARTFAAGGAGGGAGR